MRKLPFLLVLLLLSLMLLAAAASAHAFSLDPSSLTTNLVLQAEPEEEAEDEGEAADEGEEEESGEGEEEGESCGAEEDEPCEEEGEDAEAEECLLEDASASLAVFPGAEQVRLTIRYEAFEPTVVVVDSQLRGAKGGLRLGSDRAHFHRNGVYRGSFALGAKQMPKALAAREFEVDLHAVRTPADCALQLASRASHRAR